MVVRVRFPPEAQYYRSLTYKEKLIMETLSFILGIASVVVIANVIVTVVSVVKVIKVTNKFDDYTKNMSYELDIRTKDIHDQISREVENLDRRIDNLTSETFSQMDSRLDKVDNRFKRDIENLYTLINNNKN